MDRSVNQNWIQEESGQALTEYVLLVLMAVSFFLLLLHQFIQPAFQKLNQWMSLKLNNALFGADLHRFRF